MNDDEDRVVFETIADSLQDATFRAWRIKNYGRNVEIPGGCIAEIQDDGALLCIAHQVSLWPDEAIEWLSA